MRRPEANIGIIMDGNGRFAHQTGDVPLIGHKHSVGVIEDEVFPALYQSEKIFAKEVALYAFSTENWGRDEPEIEGLMKMITTELPVLAKKLSDYNVKILHAGRRTELARRFPESLQAIDHVVGETSHHTERTLHMCIDYGSLDEIERAFQKAKAENADQILPYLEVPTMDMIIRTGGDRRLSNFLMLQSAYAELFFLDKFFPELVRADIENCIHQFLERNQTFGLRPK